MSVQAVVLCGGRSRRFGRPKHLEPFGEGTLMDHVVRTAEAATGRPAVCIDRDLRPGNGPLGGIETALSAAATAHVLVLACDLPGLCANFLRLLVDHPADADVVLPLVRGRRHPLTARWHVRALPAVRAALDRGERAVRRVLDALVVAELGEEAIAAAGFEPARVLANANTPEDLRRFAEGEP